MISTDVLVVGAGPAGVAAAISLVRGGRRVVVIDKANFPRDKCCGDGLTTEALRRLERLGLRPEDVKNWNTVTDVMIRSPRGRQVRLPLPGQGQYAVVVPRSDLDQALVHLTRTVGADVREGVALDHIEQHHDHVVVTASSGLTIRSRYVVAADGMWSPTRRALGVGPSGYRGEWHAFRQYFSNVGPKAQHLVVWFEPDLLPGYAWSFPLPGQRSNVGFGIMRGGRNQPGDMKRLWADLLERPHIRDVLGPHATPEGRHKAWPIPARVGDVPLHTERVLYVGDAAAAADPLTGEGIAQALLTGMAAAAALNNAGPDMPEVAATGYQEHVQRSLVADHHFARALSKVMTSQKATAGALRLADLTPWTRRNFARWMFEDYPRALLLTPGRWKRGALNAPGAYEDTTPTAHTTIDHQLSSPV